MKVKRSTGLFAGLLLVAALVVAACSGPTPPSDARLTGTITVAGSTDRAGGLERATGTGHLGALLATWQLDESLTDFVPGELIVRFAEPAAGLAPMSVQATGGRLDFVREVGVGDSALYRLPAGLGAQAAGDQVAATLAAARELNARPDVLYAHPNYIFHALAAPNDEYYSYQWHYDQIGMEAAWDITKGSSSVVVGVVDSGILYSSTVPANRHPDFAPSRMLPGYDFITDPTSGMDGDGRDSDPFDADLAGSFHGSHVAGTIGASTDNGTGVAGVDWNAKIFSARALGKGGSGTFVDIMDAMLWSAGYTVAGVPVNANPADVINMSLGGQGTCFPDLQAAIDLVSMHSIVVVAAGNDNMNAGDFTPASCGGVITVGATDYSGARAPYSNYGSRIDVMAPGGNTSVDYNGDNLPDGVLSLVYNTDVSDWDYAFYQGTSMAAPHVAGVIALMKALNPDLDTAGALAALRTTAHELSSSQCESYGTSESRTLGSDDCGAGLIDAAAALAYVRDGTVTPIVGDLAFDPAVLDFGSSVDVVTFKVTNTGGTAVAWTLYGFLDADDNPAEVPGGDGGALYMVSGYPYSGTLAPGASVITALEVDRDALTAPGQYQVRLLFTVDGVDYVGPPARFTKLPDAAAVTGPTTVEANIAVSGQWVLSGGQQSGGLLTSYDFRAAPGLTIVGAWIDVHANSTLDTGDYVGFHEQLVAVEAGKSYTLPIEVSQYFEGGAKQWPDEWLDTLRGGGSGD
ncbi:MAG: S8 family peptidase [Trueperaceae bacterium]|nr:S8 family peptidase [Trueperaceae bacterium]